MLCAILLFFGLTTTLFHHRHPCEHFVKIATPFKLVLPLSLLLLGLLLLHVLPFHRAVTYAIVFVSTSLVYLWVARVLFISDPSPRFLFFAVAAFFLVRLSFLTLDPIGSDDVYRYMWDGKAQSSGINPYAYAPNAPELGSLHTLLLPASVNHPDMKSVYFPVSQWMFYGGYLLSGESVWGYRLIFLVAEILTVLGLFSLVSRLHVPRKFVLLYAVCPLPIIQFALDAHLDGLGLPFLVFALVSYLDGRKVLSYALIAVSISIKPVALLLLPILFLRERGVWNKVRVIVIPLVLFFAQFFPYLFTSNPFQALFTFARNWTFNGVVFETLDLLFANNQTTRLVCAVLLCCALLVLYWRKRDPFEALYYSVLLLLIFSPVVHPWYVVWLTVLLPVVQRWSGILFSSAVSLTAYTVVRYQLYGVWDQSALVLAVEYLPILVLLIFEFHRLRRDPGPGSPRLI